MSMAMAGYVMCMSSMVLPHEKQTVRRVKVLPGKVFMPAREKEAGTCFMPVGGLRLVGSCCLEGMLQKRQAGESQ